MAGKGVTVKITGTKEIIGKLLQLAEKVASEHAKEAMRKGAEIIRDEASSRAPRRTGRLAKSIVIEEREDGFYVGPEKDVFYGLFVEYGTSGHKIKPKLRKALASGGIIFGKDVQHPGIAPSPFLRPALDEKKKAVMEAVRDELKRRLEL